MTSERVQQSVRPTASRMRSAVDVHTATLLPSQGDVTEKAEERKTTTVYVTDSAAASTDVSDCPSDVTQRYCRRRRRARAAGKKLARHDPESRLRSHSHTAPSAAVTDDAVNSCAGALTPEDNKDFPVTAAKQTSEEVEVRKLDKTSKKRTAAHPRRKRSSQNDAAENLKADVAAAEEVHRDDATTVDGTSTSTANAINSSATSRCRRTRSRTSRRSSKTPNRRCSRDYQLPTDNPKIRNRLQTKKRPLRKKRTTERRKKHCRRPRKEQQRKAAEARNREPANISGWMLNQRKPEEVKQNSSGSQADKISAVIHQTFVMEPSGTPIAVEVTTKNHLSAPAVRDIQYSPPEQLSTTTDAVSDECCVERGANTATLSAAGIYSRCSSRLADTATSNRQPPTRISLPQNELQPVPDSHENYMSSTHWLLMERRQVTACRHHHAGLPSSEQLQHPADLTRQVARRRISAMLANKRNAVDNGLRMSNMERTETYHSATAARTNIASGYDRLSNSCSAQTTERNRTMNDADAKRKTNGETTSRPRSAKTMQRLMQSLNLSDRPSSRIVVTTACAFPAVRSTSSCRKQIVSMSDTWTTRTTAANSGDVPMPTFITVKKLQPHSIPYPNKRMQSCQNHERVSANLTAKSSFVNQSKAHAYTVQL